MDHEIDSLSLKIDVELNEKDLIKVSKFSTAIQKLQISIEKLDLDKLSELEVPKGLKNLQIVTQNFRAIENENKTQNLFAGVDQNAISEITTGVEAVNDGFKEQAAIMEDITPELKQVMDGYAKLFSQIFDSRKSKEKTPLDKLKATLKRIKLIAFIKAIRASINFLTGGLNQGVTSLAVFDKEFNATVSNIKTSISQTFNSLALIVRPLVEAIEPVVQAMSSAITNIANESSRIQAAIKGQATYTKINADYAEDYAKSLQKASAFSFDTFNTLNAQDSPYETASVEESPIDNSELEDTKLFIEGIKEWVSGTSKLTGEIFGTIIKIVDVLKPSLGIIFDVIGQISDLVGGTISDIVDTLSPILSLIGSGLKVVTQSVLNPIIEQIKIAFKITGDILGILNDITHLRFDKLFDSLKKLANDFIKGFARMIDSVINGLIDLINNVLFGVINKIGEFFGWQKIGIFFGRSNLESLVPSFENGGLVGELWQMNEYGVPEMLYNSNNNSNNTSVINQAQLSLAFENAIYNTGLLDVIQQAGVVTIDGKDIASSQRFVAEMNRRNKTNFR